MSADTTISLIHLALDAAMMRQTAIANNIANSNSVDYQTIEVNFEQQLGLGSSPKSKEESFQAIKPFYQLSDTHSPIEEQMALSVQNATHYRALIKGLNQKFAIMKLALQGVNQS